MASNFAFQPFGLSQRVTVVATAGTISLTIVRSGGTTLAVTAGNYPVSYTHLTLPTNREV